MRQGHGPTGGRGRRPGPAGRPHVPRHRHGRRHSTSGCAGPAPGSRSADRGSPRPANRTHPAACNVHTEPKQDQGRPGRASARVAAVRSTSAGEPKAGGRRDARAPVGRGGGAVRTVGTNGIAASGLRGRGITPRGGTGTSEAGPGPALEQHGDQSERGRWARGRGFILRAGLARFSPGILELRSGPLWLWFGVVKTQASVRAPAWGTQAYSQGPLELEHCSPAAKSREPTPRRSETKT